MSDSLAQPFDAVEAFNAALVAELAGDWREALRQYKIAYWESGQGSLVAEVDVLRETVARLTKALAGL